MLLETNDMLKNRVNEAPKELLQRKRWNMSDGGGHLKLRREKQKLISQSICKQTTLRVHFTLHQKETQHTLKPKNIKPQKCKTIRPPEGTPRTPRPVV